MFDISAALSLWRRPCMAIHLPTNERSAIGQPSPSNCSYLILNPGTWWSSMKDGFTAMPAELRAGNKFGSPDLTSSVKRLPSRGAITAWFSSLFSLGLKCPPQYLSWLASCRKPVDEAEKTYSNWRKIVKWQHLFCWLPSLVQKALSLMKLKVTYWAMGWRKINVSA